MKAASCRYAQHGLSLVETMIGMGIGLIVTGLATAALLSARNLTASAAEIAQVQQQVTYVLRVLGQQIRHAGGRAAHLPITSTAPFTVDAPDTLQNLLPVQGTLGPAAEYPLLTRQQNAAQKLYTSKAPGWEHKELIRNCLAENPGTTKALVLTSSFKLHNQQLVCAGTGAAQVLLANVADFQVLYLTEQIEGTQTSFQYVPPHVLATSEQWQQVRGIEVCLEVTGRQRLPATGAVYRRCDGSLSERGAHLQMVFRNLYHTPSNLWLIGP